MVAWAKASAELVDQFKYVAAVPISPSESSVTRVVPGVFSSRNPMEPLEILVSGTERGKFRNAQIVRAPTLCQQQRFFSLAAPRAQLGQVRAPTKRP